MKSTKREDQFRIALREREIKPSAAAWDRLDSMLSVAEMSDAELIKQISKKNKAWYFIAASVVGLMVFSALYFNAKDEIVSDDKNSMVNQEEVSVEEKTVKSPLLPIVIKSFKISNQTIQISNSSLVQSSKPVNHSGDILISKSQTAIINQKNEPQLIVLNPIPDSSANAIVANQINIDASGSVSKLKKVKVDAAGLLVQVDGELDQSFREKVFTKVTKNYQSVKVALSNRNVE